MGRQIMNVQIESFIDEFNRSVNHPILNREIGKPILDESTLFFLLLPKLNGEEWTSSTNTAAIAVGAVYAAFDAHDTVDVENVTSTSQQLSVLSGDYLSGVYYQLLASLPNFEFIHVLSKAIGEINEIKTEFHTNLEMKTSDSLEAIRSIQAECIVQFLHTFGFSQYIPLAAAGLPLMSLMVNRNRDSGTVQWTLHSDDATEALKILSAEMETAILNATFLTPELVEKTREMTMPLLGKMI
ncbi:heptaprenyl diphosphate synthase component 1 [Sporosarcina pasteurii]|uniref:Heptaprenyl diphosphate synthase component 1 n=1 Tax=Sporosarcina pasteurii TaxID=1474 RepID=A0A380BK26_SPOPA|nr:heptaprenyl diphosphate synthase component 1 [Sporosarcina pasteurii]MDS9470818.1 heptaprenyl diphosphate synthase component 1 [Sporosarcina pasteurii]QBQ05514.1 hypothetical protein E2C16_07465 [Sporosarcina pasteurii]SUJ02542.1 Heptaprenyl diphosphate synthase component 1 [Sporosarcina pasteurii]